MPIHGHPHAGGDRVLAGELLQLAGVFVLSVPGLWSLIKPPAPPRPRLPGPPHRRDLRPGRAPRHARGRGPPATDAVVVQVGPSPPSSPRSTRSSSPSPPIRSFAAGHHGVEMAMTAGGRRPCPARDG